MHLGHWRGDTRGAIPGVSQQCSYYVTESWKAPHHTDDQLNGGQSLVHQLGEHCQLWWSETPGPHVVQDRLSVADRVSVPCRWRCSGGDSAVFPAEGSLTAEISPSGVAHLNIEIPYPPGTPKEESGGQTAHYHTTIPGDGSYMAFIEGPRGTDGTSGELLHAFKGLVRCWSASTAM